MSRKSKRARANAEKVSPDRLYPLDEALQMLTEMQPARCEESVDVAIVLGVDARQSDQQVRGATVLPHGVGRTIRVAVFAAGDAAQAARQAGADLVGMEDLAGQVQDGMMDFDAVIAVPEAMSVVGKLGPILGPRGLMPNPKTGTVTADPATAVRNVKQGQLQFRTDKGGVIHGSIGRVSFSREALRENLEALLTDLHKAKPASAKGVYLKKLSLSSTFGVGVNVDRGSLGL